ncbi:acyltransferase family protein [Bacillus sp. FJAT-28004]|uniref:acyltransferase family protein n=1 Tax=Bacillus sp. FJAT-28004 TaxID=1679165 RepID=UPI0006B5A7F5|nr:acyltransferase family protein [Bacillus sp. FJAT-28004]
MVSKPNYSGLDWLKFIAALFVIANHTSPLLSYNEYTDFLFSGIISRLAVPIFFMSTGFFFFRKLTGDKVKDQKALFGYIKKIGWLYSIAILLYIPLNVYKGDFSDHFTFVSFMRDIVFDGTFYHLWYLPALIIGLFITYYLYQKLSLSMLLVIGSLLYAVGLLGDSYYGITQNIAFLKHFYEWMFHIFDYTRNGLFYAPIYLILGIWAAKKPQPARKPIAYAALFLVSLALMITEASILKAIQYPRHDSMYVFAWPATYFLFQWALSWKGRTGKAFREWRVWIYILHPIAIVLVRGAAEFVKLEALFITNSLIHFVAVCLTSIFMAAVAVRISVIKFKFRP